MLKILNDSAKVSSLSLWVSGPEKLGLSGTPLNEAIISLNTIIPAFKKENGVQKLHVSILTDGEAAGVPYFSWIQRNDDEGSTGVMFTLVMMWDSFVIERMVTHTSWKVGSLE